MAVACLRLPPSNRLEALKGDRRGQYSIRVNDQRKCEVVPREHLRSFQAVREVRYRISESV